MPFPTHYPPSPSEPSHLANCIRKDAAKKKDKGFIDRLGWKVLAILEPIAYPNPNNPPPRHQIPPYQPCQACHSVSVSPHPHPHQALETLPPYAPLDTQTFAKSQDPVKAQAAQAVERLQSQLRNGEVPLGKQAQALQAIENLQTLWRELEEGERREEVLTKAIETFGGEQTHGSRDA